MRTGQTLFDLELRCDLNQEYNQIIRDLKETHINSTDLMSMLNSSIRTWPFRQGATSITTFFRKHGIIQQPNDLEPYILYSLELIINLLYWLPVCEKQEAISLDMSNGMELSIQKECFRCLENIDNLLESINMRVRKKGTTPIPQYSICKCDAQVDAVIEVVPELSDLLLSYYDIRNRFDEQAKRNILNAIAFHIEKKRKAKLYQGTIYNQLCDDLFTVFNNSSIRHNNNQQWNLSEEERITLFDHTFKAALHLLQTEEMNSFHETVYKLKNRSAGRSD